MKKTKLTSLIIGILIIHSCKRNFEKKADSSTETRTEIKTEYGLDTVNADNYNLLLFHPTELEFEELIKKYGEESGLYEVDSDFGFYASKVYDSLSKTDLKIKILTERIIKYSTKNGIKYLDRLKNSEDQYGVIFNKPNCEPRIEFGVMTDLGMIQKLTDYNKNCK